MDGVAIVRALIVASSEMLELVPLERIVGGVLPVGTELDAISITRVSVIDRNIPSPGANRRVTERIQVTAMGRTYPRSKAALRAAKAVLADFVGTAAGLDNVCIQTDAGGPDFMNEEASIHMGTQDFIVGYTEAR
jgi:hypothetical protein